MSYFRKGAGERGPRAFVSSSPLLSFLDARTKHRLLVEAPERWRLWRGGSVPWGFTRNAGSLNIFIASTIRTMPRLCKTASKPARTSGIACRADRRAACSFEISRKNLRITVPPSFSWLGRRRNRLFQFRLVELVFDLRIKQVPVPTPIENSHPVGVRLQNRQERVAFAHPDWARQCNT